MGYARNGGRRAALTIAAAVLGWLGAAAGGEGRAFPAVDFGESFTAYVLTDGLDFPWEMLWGPDDRLWVTERHGRRITRIDPETGTKQVVATIDDAYPGPQHEGLLGMAFGPNLLRGEDDLYLYYTCKEENSEKRWGRLVRYRFHEGEEDALRDRQVLLDRIPAGDDHNGGRLRYGPDGKLYLSLGEQGHNQGGNYCLPIDAQRIPTREEIEATNWDAYRGKVLRINPDGGIPDDNPVIRGMRSHVFTYGHRNPQGLAFVGNDLYSCEQGPSSDDEINLLEAGGNYGWPHVAGFRDGEGYRYANYSAAPNCAELPYDPDVIPDGVPVQDELEWFAPDFKAPVKTFYTVRKDHNFHDPRCAPDHTYLCYPTIAPACIVGYPADGAIASWRGSLLVSTLKTGALFRLPMSGDGRQIHGDHDKLFRSRNRYRAVATDPQGLRIFIATDNSGGAKDESGNPAKNVRNPGAILVFVHSPKGEVRQADDTAADGGAGAEASGREESVAEDRDGRGGKQDNAESADLFDESAMDEQAI